MDTFYAVSMVHCRSEQILRSSNTIDYQKCTVHPDKPKMLLKIMKLILEEVQEDLKGYIFINLLNSLWNIYLLFRFVRQWFFLVRIFSNYV